MKDDILQYFLANQSKAKTVGEVGENRKFMTIRYGRNQVYFDCDRTTHRVDILPRETVDSYKKIGFIKKFKRQVAHG